MMVSSAGSVMVGSTSSIAIGTWSCNHSVLMVLQAWCWIAVNCCSVMRLMLMLISWEEHSPKQTLSGLEVARGEQSHEAQWSPSAMPRGN